MVDHIKEMSRNTEIHGDKSREKYKEIRGERESWEKYKELLGEGEK